MGRVLFRTVCGRWQGTDGSEISEEQAGFLEDKETIVNIQNIQALSGKALDQAGAPRAHLRNALESNL